MRFFLILASILIMHTTNAYAAKPLADYRCDVKLSKEEKLKNKEADLNQFHNEQMLIFESQNPQIDTSEFKENYRKHQTGEIEGNGCAFSHLPSMLFMSAHVNCEDHPNMTWGWAYQQALQRALNENWGEPIPEATLQMPIKPRYNQ